MAATSFRGGLYTVIDDSILNGKKFDFVRDFIRERFIIRGVISLHGDAFQRSGARAKTSILCLTKRADESETQPDVFVYESRYIGLDDVVTRTPPSVAEKARQAALQEMDEIVSAYREYREGKKGPWLVPASQLSERLDAKFLLPWSASMLTKTWQKANAEVELLGDLVSPVEDSVPLKPDEQYTFLRITYDGRAEPGERRMGREVSYRRIGRTKAGDIVVSNISAVYRAICVVPEDMAGLLTSSEFTVLRIKPGVRADPMYLWAILRSPAVIAEWVTSATGVGRHRVDWQKLKLQQVPLLSPAKQKELGDLYRAELRYEAEAKRAAESAANILAPLDLSCDKAKDRMERAKPPK